MRVVKHSESGIVRRVVLLDDQGDEIVPVSRFLSHLADSGYSPNTLCAYAYDLRRLFLLCTEYDLAWTEFRAPTTFEYLGYLRRVPSRGPAQQLSLAATVAEGRCLSAATVARILAATSSFYEWAIAVELYRGVENPLQKRDGPALGPRSASPVRRRRESAAAEPRGRVGAVADPAAATTQRRGHRGADGGHHLAAGPGILPAHARRWAAAG